MAVFFTSDTHFGHKNIINIDAERTRFPTISEHDELIIDLWNDVVKPDDIVWHLGDVSLSLAAAQHCVPHLNGDIRLVAGNHDLCWTSAPGKAGDRAHRMIESYYDMGFSRVYSTGQAHTVLSNGRAVDMSHLPHSGDHQSGDRYIPMRPTRVPTRKRPLLCGHVHGLWAVYNAQINVGLNVRGFAPMSEDEVIHIIERSGAL